MELYKWQEECLQAWKENGFRGIANVVTGAGKTVLALAAIDLLRETYPGLRIKIVVPTIPLAAQWNRELLKRAGNESLICGFFGGGVRDDPDRDVMIYIINSARDALAGHMRRDFALGRHVLLICDECHHYQSRENRKIFCFVRQMPEPALYHSLGLSATPFGTENDHILIEGLGREICRYGFDSAAKARIISPFTVCEVSASFLEEELTEYVRLSDEVSKALAVLLKEYPSLAGLSEAVFLREVSKLAKKAEMDPSDPAAAFMIATYQRKRVSNLAQARICCCMGLLETFHADDRVLVFCERIEQAEETASQLQRRLGRHSGLYHSGMTKEARKRVMEEFRSGLLRILVTCRCLDEGIDVPDANIGIVMSSSAVPRQRIQRLGRIIRRAEGKASACLYYIYIRESTDDSVYLKELENCTFFALRYYTAEDTFSDSLYDYSCGELLREARRKGLETKQLRELRLCMQEGLARADYLLEETVQQKNEAAAESVHERNYWKVMRKLGAMQHG